MNNHINAAALATAAIANLNMAAIEENNIRYWEASCEENANAAIAAAAAGDRVAGQHAAKQMRFARRMVEAGTARRIGR